MNVPSSRKVTERITIVGAGAVGGALATAFGDAGFSIEAVISRTIGRAAAEARIGPKVIASDNLADVPPDTSCLAICVPDDEIERAASELASHRKRWEDVLVFHSSGVHTSDLLQPLSRRGAVSGSAHPLQSFATSDGAKAPLKGVYFAIEGGQRATERLSALFGETGAVPIAVAKSDKMALHIAAVFVSNYLVTLFDCAAELLATQTQSVPDARFLIPLVEGTLRNIGREASPASALTGPVSRGDVGTIRLHLAALSGIPHLNHLYRHLGRHAVDAAVRSHRIDGEVAATLSALFETDDASGRA